LTQLDPTGAKRLHREWRRRTLGRIALVLDGVTTTWNVGGIVRTAAAFRVEQLWVSGNSTSPDHPKVRRVALGAERYVSTTEAPTAVDAIEAAREGGYRIIGLELASNATPLHEVPLTEATCIVVGHEDRGLSRSTLTACDHVAFVPQLGRVGSLNVASATAVAVYEIRRREWAAEP
jgi:tRNA (guanosine-2'-O-)-methyltransferase